MTSLDQLDLKILNQLQQDSNLTNQALSQRVHASAATCLRRVRRLWRLGYIEKQVAILSPELCGYPLTAICEITLQTQAAEELAHFEEKLQVEPWVTQCYRVSTGPDFVLILTLPDMPAYHALAQRLFTAAHQVRNVRTFFATHRSKFETALVLRPARALPGPTGDRR